MKPRVASRNSPVRRRPGLPGERERGVKFLCDRCETRYSIADERVRGKILKIRCKTCQHVITVREGMSADEPATVQARPKQTTTAAPLAHEERNERSVATQRPREGSVATQRPREGSVATQRPREGSVATQRPREGSVATARRGLERQEPVNALNAAFASAMAKPPPALEEEWYVSIDGEQAGPFSLAEAQRWVAGKPFDAELHCWSEGFDDWLPVDKVSHFRGLRKRPVPQPAPPPLPRAGGRPATASTSPVIPKVEPEPKALFAATMASLERGAPGSSAGIQLPPAARATPPEGVPAVRGNGLNGAPRLDARSEPSGAAKLPAAAEKPSGAAKLPAAGEKPSGAAKLPAPGEKPAAAASAKAAPAAVERREDSKRAPFAAPFDTSEPAEAATQLESRAYETPEGGARVEPAPASSADFGSDDGDDEELAIGEVSRVVNLADLAKNRSAKPAQRATGANPALRSTASNPALRSTASNPALRSTASNPALGSTGALPALSAAPIDGGLAPSAETDTGAALAPVHKTHRRGLIALLSVAIAMVVGAAIVVLIVRGDDDATSNRLGTVHDIDTSRPEDPITHRPLEPANPANPTNPLGPRPTPHRPTPTVPTPTRDDPAPGNALGGDEVEDMARKHQDVTQRCYMRAQRGVDSILVGDVKKIAVTLTIARDGTVTDVVLNEHGADNLGKCLIASMKGWKFRASSGGNFRFSLNFVGS
jgi:predicted Zn finger-like uncharacterized protein